MSDTPWTEITAKSGFSRAVLPESFLVSLYRSMAPYRGCAHGCRYCDGRAEKYFVEGDFERDVGARTNLPDLVAAEIASGAAAREWGAVCIGSGVTDIYQPVEAELGLTRRLLEALLPTGIPVVILTKSDLILRDFDLLSRFPKALVILTVTTVNQEHAALLEPGASPPARRLEVVRRARAAGFLSGIMAMPLCPGISDTAESRAALFAAAEEAGALFAYPGGLTLRPGRQKDLFLSLVDSDFPDLRPLYDRIYAENRPSGMPFAGYADRGNAEIDRELRARRLARLVPHRIYRELLSPPDSLFVLFCHLQSLYASRGVDVRPLEEAAGRYAAWLKEERTGLRRKRVRTVSSDPFPVTRILGEKLADLCDPGAADGGEGGVPPGFARLCGNEKLARLAGRVVAGGAVFDYPTLTAGE